MRPQYHFRDGPDGLMAWDMRKIAATTEHLTPQSVPLENIAELDENWWFAHGTTPTPRAIAGHMKLIQSADRTYPIILDSEGRLMDGMHRVVQALLAGDTTINAIRLPRTPAPDYIGRDPSDLPYNP
ncbi:hypothetical protein [uncultured Tateyamaria sp.]|uniref:hypothetical protein n=1 Tax=uncultured Tateyamaria sp. TaxID=455651 RepID=UPI00260497F0|nr:hypothetical protein [uncultured Tateyamaria sp.]